MSQRPYFRYSGKELEDLFESSKDNIEVLKALKFELSHRKSKKMRLIEIEVNKILQSTSNISKPTSFSPDFSTDKTISPTAQQTQICQPMIDPLELKHKEAELVSNQSPEKYIVECAKCNTPNFIYALDDKVQYLSCSNCRTSFEAQLKQGVLRTTFKSESLPSSRPASSNNVMIYALVAFVIIILSIYLLN